MDFDAGLGCVLRGDGLNMAKTLKFDADTVTDQKRLARGEHWLLARSILRKRDEKHHGRWRILTLAGGAPEGEMKAIRELMRNAYILSVDVDAVCLERAIDAGADDVVECDVLEIDVCKNDGKSHANGYISSPTRSYFIPKPLQNRAKFDVINLDLCGPVHSDLRKCIGLYLRQLLTPRGVMMVTFSYGRDVAEMFSGLGRQWEMRRSDNVTVFELPADVSESLGGRIMYLGNLINLRSIINYRGAEMPMCSLLYQNGGSVSRVSFVKVGRGDFELAVVYPDAANLYDCPQERIESLRRRFSAIKASITRSKVTPIQPSFLDVDTA